MTSHPARPEPPTTHPTPARARRSAALAIANEYGNVDVRWSLAKRYAHVPGQRLPALCRKLGIRFAPALTGFKRSKRRGYAPLLDGVVVSAHAAERLRRAVAERAARARTPEQREVARERRQARDAAAFAADIRARFPRMPAADADLCAAHATVIGSGRVGRSATAEDPVRAAVVAHARHVHTEYDELLADGWERWEAREAVRDDVREVLAGWEAERADAPACTPVEEEVGA